MTTITADAHVMTEPQRIKLFCIGGKAIFTLRSKESGGHFTYKVNASDDGKCFFVNVLTDGDQYSYLGIFRDGNLNTYRKTAKSRVSENAASQKTIRWFLNLLHANKISDKVEFMHMGKCCMCGRPLTNPESIESGIGPICAGK